MRSSGANYPPHRRPPYGPMRSQEKEESMPDTDTQSTRQRENKEERYSIIARRLLLSRARGVLVCMDLWCGTCGGIRSAHTPLHSTRLDSTLLSPPLHSGLLSPSSSLFSSPLWICISCVLRLCVGVADRRSIRCAASPSHSHSNTTQIRTHTITARRITRPSTREMRV